jgi:hypothetical protein
VGLNRLITYFTGTLGRVNQHLHEVNYQHGRMQRDLMCTHYLPRCSCRISFKRASCYMYSRPLSFPSDCCKRCFANFSLQLLVRHLPLGYPQFPSSVVLCYLSQSASHPGSAQQVTQLTYIGPTSPFLGIVLRSLAVTVVKGSLIRNKTGLNVPL